MALAVALILTASVHGQVRYRVIDIEVEGNRNASRSLVLGVSSIKIGNDLTPAAVSETIRRLFGLGFFSDVKVEAEEVTGGVKVFIVLDELPKLSGLEFTGNKKIDEKKFKQELSIGVGGYISPYIIHSMKTKIREMYAEKGYFQASIDHELLYSEDSAQASLKLDINERSKVKVENVVLTGGERVPAEKIIKKMRNRPRGFLLTSNFAKEKYQEDLEKIIAEYHKRGFIDAYLISDSTSIDTTRNRMTVFLEVYEGPQYYFGKAEISGNEKLPADYIQKLLKYEEGDVFDSEKYDKSLNEIHSSYWDIGHLNARINDTRKTRNDSIIDVSYELSEGLPSHVNMVRIVGNYKTKDKVIRREISMLPGQIFNQNLLIRSVRDVMALNYFENVVPSPLPQPDGDVDIEFEVSERRTGEIMAGAGYNSQDKLVGNVGVGIPNFRGLGQSVSFNVDFGRRRNSFQLSFTEPWLFGRPTLLGVSLFTVNRRWFEDYTEGRQGGSIRIGRRLRWPDNYFRIFTSYSLERNRFFDLDDTFRNQSSYKATYFWDNPRDESTNANEILDQSFHGAYPGSIASYEEQWQTASRFMVNIKRDSRNLPMFASSGSIFSYTFENTGGILGGFWEYQRHNFELAKFIPLFWKVSIGARLNFAFVHSDRADDRISISDRFTPGGTNFDGTVRGYEGGSLTPDSLVTASDTSYFYADRNSIAGVDAPEDTVFTSFRTRVRGKYMLVSNIELQVPVVDQQIYGLLFFDAGNSWLHREDIKPLTDLYRGAGIGFRVVVPGIGTIGFDFGYALDDHQGRGKGWKPHFQIGSTFR